MRTMEAFDPSTLPAVTGVPTVGEGQPQNSGLTNGCGALYFLNKSNTGIHLVFEDGSRTILPAWFARVYKLKNRSNQLWMSQAYTLNTQGNPISMLYWEAFQQGEDITGVYNGPLTYETNVGNSVPLQASATSVANDGTTVPTEFIESSISGTKQLSILTDGTLKSLKNTGNANTDFFEYAPADDAGPGGFDMVLRLIWAQSDLVFFDKIGNGEMFRIRNTQGSNSGIIVSGLGGRVRAWSVFSGTGSGTFNHGLQATPNVICPTQNTVGSQTMGWDTANATSVHITAGNGAAWSAIALLMA